MAQPSSRETEYIYNSKMEVKDMLESFLNKIPHDLTEIGTKPCYLRIHTLTIGLISYGLYVLHIDLVTTVGHCHLGLEHVHSPTKS